jgi:hypothetical protein
MSGCVSELKNWISTAITDSNRYSSTRPVLTDILSIIIRVAPSLVTEKKTAFLSRVKGARKSSSAEEASEQNASIIELFTVLLDEALRQRDPGLCEKFAQATSSLATSASKKSLNSAVISLLHPKKLSVDNDRLICDMSTLSRLISSSDMLNEAAINKVSEFVKEKILVEDLDISTARSSKGSSRSSVGGAASHAALACQGIKCWSSILIAVLTSTSAHVDAESVKFYCDEILEILFSSIKSGGSRLGKLDMTSQQAITKLLSLINFSLYHFYLHIF